MREGSGQHPAQQSLVTWKLKVGGQAATQGGALGEVG